MGSTRFEFIGCPADGCLLPASVEFPPSHIHHLRPDQRVTVRCAGGTHWYRGPYDLMAASTENSEQEDTGGQDTARDRTADARPAGSPVCPDPRWRGGSQAAVRRNQDRRHPTLSQLAFGIRNRFGAWLNRRLLGW